MSSPPRSVERRVKQHMRRQRLQFENALTTNRPGSVRLPVVGKPHKVPMVGTTHQHTIGVCADSLETNAERSFPRHRCAPFRVRADSTENNHGRSFPHDRSQIPSAENDQGQPFGSPLATLAPQHSKLEYICGYGDQRSGEKRGMDGDRHGRTRKVKVKSVSVV